MARSSWEAIIMVVAQAFLSLQPIIRGSWEWLAFQRKWAPLDIPSTFFNVTFIIFPTITFRYTFSSNDNVHKNLRGLYFGTSDPYSIDFTKIYQKKVWSPKTKATLTFMKVVIWRKSISNDLQYTRISNWKKVGTGSIDHTERFRLS